MGSLVLLAITYGAPRVLAGPGVDASRSSVVAPDGPIGHAGRWMVDRQGRVVIVHGVNMPSKWLPAHPAGLDFGSDDAELLATSGFNAVRLTVERYAVEPAPGRFDAGYVAKFADNVNHDMLETLARPYPQLVSGTPMRWSFDPSTKRFDLEYSVARADGNGRFAPGSQTAVSVPALQYPDGYVARVTGGRVVSRPNAPVLRVRAHHDADNVAVTIAPPVRTAASNSSCPPTATTAAGGVAVDTSNARAGGNGRATVCVDGTGVADGTITAGTGEANAGFLIFDGQPTNPGLAGGYIGLSRQHTLTLVGCDQGDYDPEAPDDYYSPSDERTYNNAMASLGKETLTGPDGPIGPTSPCSPQPWEPGPSGPCGGYQDPAAPPPAATYPDGAPLYVYTSGAGAHDPNTYGYVGVAGDFGGNDGASGYIQLTHDPGLSGDIATGGTSKAGGGTVAVGNDGREAGDTLTPPGTPVAVCQN